MSTTFIWDGDTPVLRFPLKDGTTLKDNSLCAVEFHIMDKKGTTLVARRPGIAVSPRAGGMVDLMLQGDETDWAGLGTTLIVKPIIHVPIDPTGAPHTAQLLSDGSFENLVVPPSSGYNVWFHGGSTSNCFYTRYGPENGLVDTAPPSIYGHYIQVTAGTNATNEYLAQSILGTTVVGHVYSGGVWARGENCQGAPDNTWCAAIYMGAYATLEGSYTNFDSGTFNWTFYRVSHRVTIGGADGVQFQLRTMYPALGGGSGAMKRLLVDDAYFFRGTWATYTPEPMRVVVKPRRRTTKWVNQIAAIGSFEVDSNGDGVPDGWYSTNARIMSLDSKYFYTGSKSLKIAPTGVGALYFRTAIRGAFKAGELWEVSFRLKNLAPISRGSVFTLSLFTNTFDSSLGKQTYSTSLPPGPVNWSRYSASLLLTADRAVLYFELRAIGTVGTFWIDDAQFTRVM